MGMLDVLAIVKPWLKDASHETVTASLLVSGGSMLLVGTRLGDLVILRTTSPSAAGEPEWVRIFSQRLHCGALYDIALSSTQLIATVGHDAVCCLFPLADVIGSSSIAPHSQPSPAEWQSSTTERPIARRLCGHTMPVLSALFFSDGSALATLSAHGELILFDAESGEILDCFRCGFPARTLAFSADEALCFVGGKMLARVDLAHKKRGSNSAERGWALAQGSVEGQQPWLHFCCWPHPGTGAHSDTDGSAPLYVTPPDCAISSLFVSKENGSLAALVTTGKAAANAAKCVGLGHWSFASASPALADSYTHLNGDVSLDVLQSLASRTTLHATAGPSQGGKSSGALPATISGVKRATASPRAAAVSDLQWCDVADCVLAARRHANHSPMACNGRFYVKDEPLPKVQRLETAEIRRHALQLECNILSTKLRAALTQ